MAISMRFRLASQEDLSVIITWIADTDHCRRWAGPVVNFPLTPESLMKEITYSPDNSYCLVRNGNIIGFGQLIRKNEHLTHAARIIVAPHLRGLGIGEKLCRALINRAIELGNRRISLNVYKDNQAALKLYRSLGFHEIEKPGEGTRSDDISYMELDIGS